MICFPNAKINIGLSITAKRPDGFHDLESCFYPVPWYDVLEIVEADRSSMHTSGIDLPDTLESDNLCMRAYSLLREDFSLPPVKIHLHKNIPVGAGLGGGSSDAAFCIKLLNEKFSLGLSIDRMEEYARLLGSDCAFFIRNQATFAYEKGDRFRPLELSLKGYYILMVYPALHISTKEAYAGVNPALPEHSLEKSLSKNISQWQDRIQNDFEKSISENYPQISEIKNTLYKNGALYSSMTGSGSCVYGIFEKETEVFFSKEWKVMGGILE